MEDFDHLEGAEKLKAENEFMKMKLMLEKDANFPISNSAELPAETENEFLRYIIEFEKQFEEHKTIKVFDKIGRPEHFKPATEIPDDKIDKAWDDLEDHLDKYGITLGACSPNISKRELYRFTLEELFAYEMDDMNIPGMMHGFIYDEFHPDPVYDNTRAATEDCISYILQQEPLQWTHHFSDDGLRLNGHYPLSIDELKNIVNRFKEAYDSLEINEIEAGKCIIDDNLSTVTGKYAVTATIDSDIHLLSGNWKVIFLFDDELGYWYITTIEIKGINF
jgi:hypothetical protein